MTMIIKRALALFSASAIILCLVPPPTTSATSLEPMPAPPDALAVQGQTYEGMDVIFALDVSGSMYEGMNSVQASTSDAPDYGWNILAERPGEVNQISAADPGNVRFDMARFMLDWLADLSATQTARGRNFQVYGSVVTFGSTVETLLPWRVLSRSATVEAPGDEAPEGETAASGPVDFQTPAPPAGQVNSSYLALYQKLDELMTNRPDPSSESKRLPVVIIISDSLPCDKGFDINCTDFNRQLGQARQTWDPLPTNAHVHLYLIAETSTRSYYQAIDWTQVAPLGPEYVSAIHAVGPDVMNTLIQESQDVLGIENNTELQEVQTATLNLPPYQASAEILVVLDQPQSGTPTFTFVANPGEGERAINHTGTPVIRGPSGEFRRYSFEKPDPGLWKVENDSNASFKAFVYYRPAQATLSLSSPGPVAQFTPVTVTYQLVADGTPIRQPDYDIDLTTTLITPDQASHSLTMQPVENHWEAQFMPVTDGQHTIEIEAKAAATWSEQPGSEALIDPIPSRLELTVDPVVVSTLIGTPAQRSASNLVGDAKPLRSSPLQIASAHSVPVRVELTDGVSGQSILSDQVNISGELSFDGTACPDAPQALIRPTGETYLSAEIKFPDDTNGNCNLTAQVRYVPKLPPFAGVDQVIAMPDAGFVGAVNVTATYYLKALWDAGGQQTDVEFSLNDRDLSAVTASLDTGLDWPVEWVDGSQEIHIKVLVDDASQTPKDPDLIGADGTVDPALVPFVIEVLDKSGTDVAAQYDVVLKKADAPGLYTFTLTGMEPGDYTIQVKRRADVTLANNYAWKNQTADDQPLLIARLVVDTNPVPTVLLGAKGLLLALILIAVIYRSVKWFLEHRNPLRGQLAIYEKHKDRRDLEQVWDFNFTPLKKNTHVFRLAELPLWRPPITGMVARTRNTTDGSVWLQILINDEPHWEDWVRPAEEPEKPFYSDDVSDYFLYKDPARIEGQRDER